MATTPALSIPDGTSINDAREQIYEEIRQHERRIFDLKAQLNIYPPIATLPPEILLEIFAMLVENRYSSCSMRCVPVTHVCRRWRMVALEGPSLWASINSTTRPWTLALLDRSKTSPLSVFLDETSSFDVIRPIFSHLARIKSFQTLEWPKEHLQEMYTAIKTNSNLAPCLETLSLRVYDDSTGSRVLPSTTFQQTDRLRYLNLENVCLDWNHSPILHNIKELELQILTGRHRPTWRDLVASLNQMPVLETLTLDSMLPYHPDDLPDLLSGHLPSLKRVVFRYLLSIDVVTVFLRLFRLPPGLETIILEGPIDHDPNRQQLCELHHALQGFLPNVISRVQCLNIVYQRVSGDLGSNGIVLLDCFTALRCNFFDNWFETNWDTDPANIGLMLPYDSSLVRETILADALDILHLRHVKYLRIGEYAERADLLPILEMLPELRVVQAFGQATVHFFLALKEAQDHASGDSEGATILPKLAEIRISNDHSLVRQPECLVPDDAWQNIESFLAQRKSRQAGIHMLYISHCRNISEERIQVLRNYVDHLEWDGICKERPIQSAA